MRILLADDNPLFLKRAVALLQLSFNVVGTAANGEELVSQAAQLDPDIIVTDISMPILSGIEAVRKLHASGCRAKFVFLTIHSEEEFVQASRAEGAAGYVVKTRMVTDLIPAIEAASNGLSYISQSISG
jgi:DNA-binding NarL/FixJ family response regulator